MVDSRATFSLLDEPWIPCLLTNGSTRELGLLEIFARANEVRDIVGEISTQTFAIVRLLLAILHRTLGEEYEGVEDWEQLWTDGIPASEVAEYLEQYRDRFDLLHPSMPFFQVADLHTAKNDVKDITPLLFDVPSNNRLFTARAGSALDGIGFGEAARWLIHTHAFDPSGIKSGMVGDDRVKGGRGYPIGTGWVGTLGGVLVEGKTLAQTLMLNLVPVAEDLQELDLPPWERDQYTAAAREDAVPHGPVDLLTWQSRRIRLVRDGDRVVGSLVGNGDRITPQNRFGIEFHSAWRFSKPQTAKNRGQATYMPREHQLGRAFWRGISGLVVQSAAHSSAGSPPTGYPPESLTWLMKLRRKGFLPRTQSIMPRAFGVVYGSQQSVVNEVIDDRVLMPLAALDGEGEPALSAIAQRAVLAANNAVREFAQLGGNLALAAGGDAEGPRERAFEDGFAALDAPFRAWLASLEVEQSAEPQLNRWLEEVGQIMRNLGDIRVGSAGDVAWTGRTVTVGGKDLLMTTNIADRWFHFGLRRALAQLGEEVPLNGATPGEQREGAK